MTIYLPEGKWASRRMRARLSLSYLYRRCRGKIDYKWNFQQSVPGAKRKDIKRVTIKNKDGRTLTFVKGKVPFEPFTINSNVSVNESDTLGWNWFEGGTEGP